MFAALVFGLTTISAVPPVSLSYTSFRGLEVKVGDVALIEGSGFQYYEKGWTKGYFSSAWKPVKVYPGENGSFTVIADSDDGEVANRQTFYPTEKGFRATAEFRWRGEKPVMLEYTLGRLWAPFVDQGSLELDGAQVPMLDKPVKEGSTFEQRVFGQGRQLVFNAPAARVTMTSRQPVYVMDARNYTIEWADGKELFWLGLNNQEIKPQGTVQFEYELRIDPAAQPGVDKAELALAKQPIQSAQGPDVKRFPIVPKPKIFDRGSGYLACGGGFDLTLPAGLEGEKAWFERFIGGSWDWEKAGQPVSVRVSISPGVTKPHGYRLEVGDSGAVIVGQSLDGARYGLRTLAQMVQSQGQTIVLPRATVTDWPSAQWRGAHLFVGPTAVAFQGKLSDRVLAPVKLNKIVLQAEQTQWNALPGIENPITMKTPDLVKLVDHYRSLGFEFIPLVQSMGHMEWFFRNDKNLDLAVNPKIPYTIDVRKARTREILNQLWGEVADLTKPKVFHFGLDEIDNRGIDDKNLTTRLWQRGVPLLQKIAADHNADMMLWGDMLLAQGEAVDAMHAPSKEAAVVRRNMLKKGTYVADWHYRNDPNPDVFDRSLKLFMDLGLRPIASTWYRPNNIRGFTLSAIRNDAGVLQTTWAGYESSEANMVREFQQFSAFILMAEYAWSGRTDMPDKLGYDPAELMQRWYFGGRQIVKPVDGYALGSAGGDVEKIGPYKVQMIEPQQLFGVTTSRAFASPHHLTLPIDQSAKAIILALDSAATITDVALAGHAVVHYSDGTNSDHEIRYGMHVRSVRDTKATMAAPRKNTVSAVRIEAGGKRVKSVELVASHSAAGLRLHGVTVL